MSGSPCHTTWGAARTGIAPSGLGAPLPQPIRPGAVRRSLRQMAEIAQNAVIFAARWLKSHGMRCAPAAPSRTGLARLINDLGFCNRRSRQETRFARFGANRELHFGTSLPAALEIDCTSANFCQPAGAAPKRAASRARGAVMPLAHASSRARP